MDFNSEKLDIPCGKCGKKMTETIRRLKANPVLTCFFCGDTTTVELKKLVEVTKSTQKATDSIRKALK